MLETGWNLVEEVTSNVLLDSGMDLVWKINIIAQNSQLRRPQSSQHKVAGLRVCVFKLLTKCLPTETHIYKSMYLHLPGQKTLLYTLKNK